MDPYKTTLKVATPDSAIKRLAAVRLNLKLQTGLGKKSSSMCLQYQQEDPDQEKTHLATRSSIFCELLPLLLHGPLHWQQFPTYHSMGRPPPLPSASGIFLSYLARCLIVRRDLQNVIFSTPSKFRLNYFTQRSA